MTVKQILAWEKMGRPVKYGEQTLYLSHYNRCCREDHAVVSDVPDGSTNRAFVEINLTMVPISSLSIDESLIEP